MNNQKSILFAMFFLLLLSGCMRRYYDSSSFYFIKDDYLKRVYKGENKLFKYELLGTHYYPILEGSRPPYATWIYLQIRSKTTGTLLWDINEIRLVSDDYIFKPVESFLIGDGKYVINGLKPMEIKPKENKRINMNFYTDSISYYGALLDSSKKMFPRGRYFDILLRSVDNDSFEEHKMKKGKGFKFEMGRVDAGVDSFTIAPVYSMTDEDLLKIYKLKPKVSGIAYSGLVSWTLTPGYKQFSVLKIMMLSTVPFGIRYGASLFEYNWLADGREKKTWFPLYLYAVPYAFPLDKGKMEGLAVPVYLYYGGGRNYWKTGAGISFPIVGVEAGMINISGSEGWEKYIGLTLSLGGWAYIGDFDGMKMPKRKK